MKRVLLLCAGLFIGTSAFATTLNNQAVTQTTNNAKRYHYAQPITFIERGVEFLIFPDGSFDFNTHILDDFYNDDVYFKSNSKRSSINASYRGPNVNVNFTTNRGNRGVNIVTDRNGKVRRIGNVFINYDRYGNITRAGSVFIRYGRGRNATLTQVGGLYVNYNRWGEIINTRGYVNYNNRNCNYDVISNNDRYNENDYYNGDNYYYYKQNGTVKKQKKNRR
ncbi:hypothetical protein PK35_08070 [Tamlana nanhaiensis]|uniref:Uncharacterized protein n=1 Tax=Neotamlana nanhaiensis TaxID=1382798 RepID=A0A0D7W2I8_9FLAO|nr:hypothetical protein [Tamlana nanhaiensis]KJD32923.1 hypothetical protein PK35_08070 [Tamlana nanhaiensis]